MARCHTGQGKIMAHCHIMGVSMGRKPSAAQDKFIVRLPDGMREQLKAAAEGNGR